MGDFATSLLIVSVLTSLITQGLKTVLEETGWNYAANTLAGAVAAVVGAVAGIVSGYGFIGTIVLMVLSWLCAMLGYDKVKQALEQIKE